MKPKETLGKNILGRGNSKSKGPETLSLQLASMAGGGEHEVAPERSHPAYWGGGGESANCGCGVLGTPTWNEAWLLGGHLPAWGLAEHAPALCLHAHHPSPKPLPQPDLNPSIPFPSPFLEPDGMRLEAHLWKRKSTGGKMGEPWEKLLTTSLFWDPLTNWLSPFLLSFSLLPTIPSWSDWQLEKVTSTGNPRSTNGMVWSGAERAWPGRGRGS